MMNLNTISLPIKARPTNHSHGSICERKNLPVLYAHKKRSDLRTRAHATQEPSAGPD